MTFHGTQRYQTLTRNGHRPSHQLFVRSGHFRWPPEHYGPIHGLSLLYMCRSTFSRYMSMSSVQTSPYEELKVVEPGNDDIGADMLADWRAGQIGERGLHAGTRGCPEIHRSFDPLTRVGLTNF